VKKWVVHFKKEPYDIYIGRPSEWGNPFSHKENTIAQYQVSSLDESLSAYKAWVYSQPDLILKIRKELKGKVLGCWCSPSRCHGDILAHIANALIFSIPKESNKKT
jgi:hypothetical protein